MNVHGGRDGFPTPNDGDSHLSVHPAQLAEAIRANVHYQGQSINLVQCRGANAGAQELANNLGVPVTASTQHVALHPLTGTIVVQGGSDAQVFGTSPPLIQVQATFPREQLASTAGALPHELRKPVADHLRSAPMLLVWMELTDDLLEGRFRVPGGSAINSDGVHYSRLGTADYVEHDSIDVPAASVLCTWLARWPYARRSPPSSSRPSPC